MRKSLLQIRILLLIILITVINYFDRNAISYAILPIQSDLGINSAQFGIIAASWAVGYLVAFFEGFLIDRFGSVKVWLISAILWSLLTMMISQVNTFFIFCLLRFFLGVAEGAHFPSLTKTVADWMEPRWRTRCMSLSLLGVPFSSVVGAPFLTYLIEARGWREMFLILGLFGFLWAVLWHFNFRKETNPHRSALETGMNPNEKILKVIFTSPALLINCFVFFTFGYALFFALIWLPGFLEKSHGVTIARTGILVILPWAVSSITILLSGFLSDFLWKKKAHLRASRVYLIGFGMLFASFFFFGITLDNELEVDLILIALGLGSIFLANPPIYSLVADLSPHSTGTAQAVHSFFFALSGVISPAFTGWLVHATGHFRIPIFFVAGLSFLAGILSLCFQFPDKRPKHF